MTIRSFEEKDRSGLVGLWKECNLVRDWNDPDADIARTLDHPCCDILVLELSQNDIVGSIIVGWDGHRGWVYYLAVSNRLQGTGWGRKLMEAAEDKVVEWGGQKMQLMIRTENHAVSAFYSKIGYMAEDRLVMSRWLETEKKPNQLHVTTYYLAMDPPGPLPDPICPNTDAAINLSILKQTTVSFYRYLYNTIGEDWLWFDKRRKSDEEIVQTLENDHTVILLLTYNGTPAGFAELNFECAPEHAELAYFGLLPDFIGKKLGPYLLKSAIKHAWDSDYSFQTLKVNTCSLDHPSALSLYKSCGFVAVKEENETIIDPRAQGLIPAHISTPQDKQKP